MNIFFPVIFTILLIASSIVILMIGIFLKRKKLFIISGSIFIGALLLGGFTAFQLAKYLYQHALAFLTPRSDLEIYVALLGKPESDCVTILHAQDQVVPRLDPGIFLHFTACPEECGRILSEFEYRKEHITGDFILSAPNASHLEWWQIQNLGDTIQLFEYSFDGPNHFRRLWISMDSTEVYLADFLD